MSSVSVFIKINNMFWFWNQDRPGHVVVQGDYEMFLFMESSQHASCRIWYCRLRLGSAVCFNNNFLLLCLFYKFMIDVYMRGLMLLRLPWTIANDLIISNFNTHATPQFIILTLEGDKVAWVWGLWCHNPNNYTNSSKIYGISA